MRSVLLVVPLVVLACDTNVTLEARPEPTRTATAGPNVRSGRTALGSQLAAQDLVIFDKRGTHYLLGRAAPQLPDSDQPPSHELLRFDARNDLLRPVRDTVSSAIWAGADVLAVTTDGDLLRIGNATETRLLTQTTGRPALRPDGSVVVSRVLDLGETDLWLVPVQGQPRAIVTGPGGDDLPTALPNGDIAFVSARSTVASLWVWSEKNQSARQVTNRGLSAGGALTGFVPPPNEVVEARANYLRYDSGAGDRWHVELSNGAAWRI